MPVGRFAISENFMALMEALLFGFVVGHDRDLLVSCGRSDSPYRQCPDCSPLYCCSSSLNAVTCRSVRLARSRLTCIG
jgi:hypothetical protein